MAAQQSPAPSDAARYSLSALLDGSAFVPIPAGETTMGSLDGNADERPLHRVRISHAFEMGKFEVTQSQWDAVMRNPHSRPNAGEGADAMNPSRFKGPTRPVENVPWKYIQEFLAKLNQRDPKHTYRLPSEAEWEYAAKAGIDKPTAAEDLPSTAWCESNSGGETHPVGQKKPNGWGLYDMFGNVQEWVQDWYAPDYYASSPPADPQGPGAGSYRVYRGGGWLSNAKYCRAAFRAFDFPVAGHDSVGFRLARTEK